MHGWTSLIAVLVNFQKFKAIVEFGLYLPFESIVAFNVDRSKSMLVSAPIRNRQPVEGAEDYRHHPENKLEENKAAIEGLVAQAFTLYKE